MTTCVVEGEDGDFDARQSEGHIDVETPVDRRLALRAKRPVSCTISAYAQLDGDGRVTVRVRG